MPPLDHSSAAIVILERCMEKQFNVAPHRLEVFRQYHALDSTDLQRPDRITGLVEWHCRIL